ncbi:MAG: hypothetical protein FWD78_03390 [Treponema sp.]|nr:hypothetical protein [Treponema sp.]
MILGAEKVCASAALSPAPPKKRILSSAHSDILPVVMIRVISIPDLKACLIDSMPSIKISRCCALLVLFVFKDSII